MKKILLFTTGLLFSVLTSHAQTILAKWTFENNLKSESSIVANNNLDMDRSTLSFSGRPSYGGYNSDGYFEGNSWKFTGGAPNGYVVFPGINTVGNYDKVTVKFAFQFTALYMYPPKEYRVDANIDGSSTWTSLKVFSPEKNSNWQYFELEMTSEVLNKSAVSFRIAANTNKDFDDFGGADGYIAIDEVEIIATENTSSIKENLLDGLSVYPNPTTDYISVSGVEKVDELEVYTATGQLAKQAKATSSINISNLPAGIYSLVIKSGGVTTTKKIIKR